MTLEQAKLNNWLLEHGVLYKDIMQDEHHHSYVMGYDENGTASEEGYSVKLRKIYLPAELEKHL